MKHLIAMVLLGLLALFVAPPMALGGDAGQAVNGDTNGDGDRDISDATYYLRWLFQGGPEPVEIVCPADQGDRVEELEDQLIAANAANASLQEQVAACAEDDSDRIDELGGQLAEAQAANESLEAELETANGIIEAGGLGWVDLLCGDERCGMDLSGRDLSGADLSGVNMSNVNLSGADLTETDFTDADLSGANLSGADLSSAVFTNASLAGATLVGVDISSGVNFSGVDFTGAVMTEDGADAADFFMSLILEYRSDLGRVGEGAAAGEAGEVVELRSADDSEAVARLLVTTSLSTADLARAGVPLAGLLLGGADLEDIFSMRLVDMNLSELDEEELVQAEVEAISSLNRQASEFNSRSVASLLDGSIEVDDLLEAGVPVDILAGALLEVEIASVADPEDIRDPYDRWDFYVENETEFGFISRLLEHEGISDYFIRDAAEGIYVRVLRWVTDVSGAPVVDEEDVMIHLEWVIDGLVDAGVPPGDATAAIISGGITVDNETEQLTPLLYETVIEASLSQASRVGMTDAEWAVEASSVGASSTDLLEAGIELEDVILAYRENNSSAATELLAAGPFEVDDLVEAGMDPADAVWGGAMRASMLGEFEDSDCEEFISHLASYTGPPWNIPYRTYSRWIAERMQCRNNEHLPEMEIHEYVLRESAFPPSLIDAEVSYTDLIDLGIEAEDILDHGFALALGRLIGIGAPPGDVFARFPDALEVIMELPEGLEGLIDQSEQGFLSRARFGGGKGQDDEMAELFDALEAAGVEEARLVEAAVAVEVCDDDDDECSNGRPRGPVGGRPRDGLGG